MNLYGFAGGDPVNFSDPLGLFAMSCPPDCGFEGDPKNVSREADWHASLTNTDRAQIAGLMVGGAAIGAGVAALGVEAAGLAALRAEYVGKVGALAETGRRLLDEGGSEESVARTLHGMRRALGEEYKQLTPFVERMGIYGRNLIKYGDRLGPSVDYLREQGKSWAGIIESASRTFGGR